MDDADGGPDLGRRASEGILAAVGWFNLVAASLYFIFAAMFLNTTLFATEVRDGQVTATWLTPGVYGLILASYASALLASHVGIRRQKDWAWPLTMSLAALSMLFAVVALFRQQWGSLAFSLLYAVVVGGCLLRVRRA